MKLVATTLLLVACDSPEPRPAPTQPAPTEATPRLDLGSCSLDITRGGLGVPASTVTEVTPGGAQVSAWGDKLAIEGGLVIRCAGPKTAMLFSAREPLPLAPSKYAISPHDHAVEMTGQVDGARFSMTDGVFELTAFDEAHVAGTFELRTVFSRDSSRVAGKVKGTFDVKCPHAPCQR